MQLTRVMNLKNLKIISINVCKLIKFIIFVKTKTFLQYLKLYTTAFLLVLSGYY